jgi:hypothetical protein
MPVMKLYISFGAGIYSSKPVMEMKQYGVKES